MKKHNMEWCGKHKGVKQTSIWFIFYIFQSSLQPWAAVLSVLSPCSCLLASADRGVIVFILLCTMLIILSELAKHMGKGSTWAQFEYHKERIKASSS